MIKTIKECVTVINENNGTKQLVALYTDGTVESVGIFYEHEPKVESIIPMLRGLTYSQAKRVIESRM